MALVDFFASVDVDDRGVTVAGLDLGHDRSDVVLLRDDVRGVGRGEVGRVAGLLGEVGDSWLAYFVIGTASPAAMTLTPGLARSAGVVMPAWFAVGTMTVNVLPGEGDGRAARQPLVDELLRVRRVGGQEDVGRGALLDLGLESRRGVGRDGQGRARDRGLIGRLDLVERALERGGPVDGQFRGRRRRR